MAKRSNFSKQVLGNGLTVLTERHEQFRGMSLGMWVKVGTRHEATSVAGVSHFLEHMLFKGTARRTALDIAREIDQVGGDFNAFTAREYTCFHLLILDRDLNLGLDILTDVLMNSTFSAEEFERERRVILQEISMVAESPEELLFDLFFERVYAGHGLGRPILGTPHSIRRMSRAKMVRFFRNYYRPDQMVFSIAGNVDAASVKRKLGALRNSRWPGRPLRQSKAPVSVLPAPRSGLWWEQRATEQVHLAWGVPGLPYGARDRFAMLLLNVYLGSGMSSTLFQEIREKKGLAYSVYSSVAAFVDTGMFTVYAATGMKQVAVCLRLIEECVARVERELLSAEDLSMIKNNLKGTILLSADDVESRMMSIAKNDLFLGKQTAVAEVCRQIDEVTPQDIRRVARRLFRADRSILALGPKPPRDLLAKLPFSRAK